ncbi:DNA repair protein XRCC3 homolog [Chenopodium quinoa]|uniref:DNA repair protein XRCC3 homolog n=1 Tax=Chenopodium quinoa TaxID=63459 RepID=UPI000B776E5C|nr:DNA repair protein XRCC3 homolog [Chenopodium quinoa]
MNQKCKTKCQRLDLVLDGGVCTGEVTEIYGESGVGKTQICLQLVLNCTLLPEDGGLYGSSIYIQVCPVFLVNMLSQISTHLLQHCAIDENPLSLVQVKKVDNPQQILLVLNQVEKMVLYSHEGCRHTRVVVLDSIAHLFRDDHDNTSKGYYEWHRMLVAVARKMKQIAESYNIALIVVNEVTDVFDAPFRSGSSSLQTYTSGREVKPSLGTAWG